MFAINTIKRSGVIDLNYRSAWSEKKAKKKKKRSRKKRKKMAKKRKKKGPWKKRKNGVYKISPRCNSPY